MKNDDRQGILSKHIFLEYKNYFANIFFRIYLNN